MGQFSDDFNDGSEGQPLDRVHELSWALLDDHISDEGRAELENLLLNDPTARESYVPLRSAPRRTGLVLCPTIPSNR